MKNIVLGILAFSLVTSATFAQKINVYFGTGSGQSKGIYFSKFDTAKGKLTTPQLAAEVKRPGFLAWLPDGKTLYAAASIDDGPAAVGV